MGPRKAKNSWEETSKLHINKGTKQMVDHEQVHVEMRKSNSKALSKVYL